VRLSRDAATIAGAHGAGFANLLFATRARVIEPMPPGAARADFQALTAFVEGEHLALALRIADEGALKVDLGRLERSLEGGSA